MISFLSELDIKKKCKSYGVPLRQCPDFLFLVLGIIIIILIIASYFIAIKKIEDIRVALLTVLGFSALLVIINFIIIRSVERIVQASRSQLEFINVISHQLKAPITNISFILDAFFSKKKELTEQDKNEYLKMLKENNERMRELVKNILTVAKLEAGLLNIKKEFVSLDEIVDQKINDFKLFAQALNVKIEKDFDKSLPKIYVDSFWVKEVIGNLLDNAIKYSRGNVFIKLKCQKGKVFFEIEDNGKGIPKEEQKFIFQRFFRVKNGSTHALSGSGLGLYLSKKLVELMGGKIGFISKYNKGSKFWFSLPISS
ncbi:MAG: sensor histidine kinase [Minisyncoccia bacterium]